MTVVTVSLMVGIRHLLRQAYLKPYLDAQNLAVQPQWSVIALFLVLFVGGLATIAWMLWKVAGPKTTPVGRSQAA